MRGRAKVRRRRGPRALALLALAAALVAAPAAAHEGEDHGAAGSAPSAAGAKGGDRAAIEVELPDLEMLDRAGKKLKFRSEVLADRIVAIDFVYTTCSTVCPVISSVFANVQDSLGARLGKEVWLITISIDPTRDTPRRMDAYARKFAEGPGWIWLTGRKRTVDRVLRGLGAYTPEVVDHPPMVVIGDARENTWTRLNGIPAPDDVLARLDAFVAARAPSKTSLRLGD
ncbi:MAG: SCO family protein [Rhodospirillales bacterium]|nr:SCO family protein [Rhodospirillales bacterium]